MVTAGEEVWLDVTLFITYDPLDLSTSKSSLLCS